MEDPNRAIPSFVWLTPFDQIDDCPGCIGLHDPADFGFQFLGVRNIDDRKGHAILPADGVGNKIIGCAEIMDAIPNDRGGINGERFLDSGNDFPNLSGLRVLLASDFIWVGRSIVGNKGGEVMKVLFGSLDLEGRT
jgi:hypothetical protein